MSENQTPTAGTPRWVKVFGIVALIIVVLVVVVLIGRGGHGPSRHTGDLDPSGGHTGPLPGVIHEQP
jgi:hypothetical protein